MESIFLQILNMSLMSSIVIVVVMALRLLLKKVPKNISYALWSVVLFRLICPFSFESVFSLIPSSKPLPPEILTASEPTINSGIAIIDRVVTLPSPMPGASVNPMQIILFVGSILWLAGVTILVVYSIISYIKLKYKVKTALLIEHNVYECPAITSPFVLGILKPKIYLPMGLSENEKAYILKHEQTHISRLDMVIKPISFFVVCVHWFNPLCWLAFVLMSKDMELSCDEAVIKIMGSDIKCDYSTSLLSLATPQKMLSGSPLAFGESNVKARIKNVLNYKKPVFWIVVAIIVAVAIIGIGLIANPLTGREELKWARKLSLKDVERIQLITQPSAISKRYREYSVNEFDDIIKTINKSNGRPLEHDETLAGNIQTFYITLKDGQQHSISNAGNVYLIIDGKFYEGNSKRLSQWNYRGNTAVPDTFHRGETPATDIYLNSGEVSPSDFVNSLAKDLKMANGTASFTIPNKMPPDYDISQLSITVSGSIPTDEGNNVRIEAFNKENDEKLWELGKTYSAVLIEGDVPDETKVYINVSLMEKDSTTSKFYTVNSKVFPLRDDTTTPNVTITANDVTFINKFGDNIKLTIALPTGWTMKQNPLMTFSDIAPSVDIYDGDTIIGGIFCSDFDLYRDDNGDIPYMSVYNSIMLGSGATWDNEYTETSKTNTTAVATCKPWQKIDTPGISRAAQATQEDKGILTYNADLLKFVAISVDHQATSAKQWSSIAKSIKLSGKIVPITD